MRLFLDCEFNSMGGELISLALVPEDASYGYFYEVVTVGAMLDPWVAEHVVPHLHLTPISVETRQESLESYLAQFDTVHIVADWPDDIAYFSRALITGPGTRIDTPPLTMEVLRVDAPSELPHNALFDARGIREFVLAQEASAEPCCDDRR